MLLPRPCCILKERRKEQLSLYYSVSRGLLLSALGAFFYSLTGLLTKLSCSAGMPILNLLLYRFLVQGVITAFLCTREKEPIWPHMKTTLAFFLFARAVIAVVCHALYYIGLSRVPLGDAAALGLTATIWAASLGSLLQKEGLGWLWSMCILCCAGILLIAKPGKLGEALGGGTSTAANSVNEASIVDSLSTDGAVIVLCVGAFMHGLSFVLGRHVATRSPPILSLFLMMLFGGLSFLPFVLVVSPFRSFFFTGLDYKGWIGVILIPFVGLGAQLCLISSLKFEGAGTVAVIQNLDAVFSYAFQLAIGEGFNVASLSGASLIVLAAVVIAIFTVRKSIKTKTQSPPPAVSAARIAGVSEEEETATSKAEETAEGTPAAATSDTAIAIAVTDKVVTTSVPPRSSSFDSCQSFSSNRGSAKGRSPKAAENVSLDTHSSETKGTSTAICIPNALP